MGMKYNILTATIDREVIDPDSELDPWDIAWDEIAHHTIDDFAITLYSNLNETIATSLYIGMLDEDYATGVIDHLHHFNDVYMITGEWHPTSIEEWKASFAKLEIADEEAA